MLGGASFFRSASAPASCSSSQPCSQDRRWARGDRARVAVAARELCCSSSAVKDAWRGSGYGGAGYWGAGYGGVGYGGAGYGGQMGHLCGRHGG